MSDLEARIAEVLADHQFQPGFFRCACGKSVADAQLASRAIAAHQASMLAPVIREAQAEAWDAGYAVGNAHNGRRDTNPYKEES